MPLLDKRGQKNRRRNRIRRKVFGTAERPRLSVYRSNVHIYAQLIDDLESHTLAAAESQEVTGRRTVRTRHARSASLSRAGPPTPG